MVASRGAISLLPCQVAREGYNGSESEQIYTVTVRRAIMCFVMDLKRLEMLLS